MDLASYAAAQQQRQDDQFRNLLNMFMTMKQYQQEQGWKQKNYDLNQAETDAVVKWRQAQAQKALTPTPAKPSPLVEQAKIMVSEGLYPTMGQAIKALHGVDKQAKPEKTLADKAAEWETEAKIKAKYRPAQAPKTDKNQLSVDYAKINRTITAIKNRKSPVEKKMAAINKRPDLTPDEKDDEVAKLQPQLDAYDSQIAEATIMANSLKAGIPLSQESIDILNGYLKGGASTPSAGGGGVNDIVKKALSLLSGGSAAQPANQATPAPNKKTKTVMVDGKQKTFVYDEAKKKWIEQR